MEELISGWKNTKTKLMIHLENSESDSTVMWTSITTDSADGCIDTDEFLDAEFQNEILLGEICDRFSKFIGFIRYRKYPFFQLKDSTKALDELMIQMN